MKKYALLFCAAAVAVAFFLSAAPVHAFQTQETDPKAREVLQKMGTDLSGVAARFGCDTFAWGNFLGDGRVAALEFVPKGHQPDTWTRLVSMAIYALPVRPEAEKKQQSAAQLEMMRGLAGSLLEGFSKNAKILDKAAYENEQGEPGLFIEYTVGEGEKQEHNAGVFMRMSERTAGFIQVQRRGGKLSSQDIDLAKALLSGKKG